MNPSPVFYDLIRGASAAAVQIAAGEFLAALFGVTNTPLRATGRWLIDVLPGPLVDVSLALLQRRDKAVLLWTLVLVALGVTGAAAVAGTFTAAAVLVALGLVSLVAAWRRPELPHWMTLVVGAGAAVAGPASLLFAPLPTAISISAGALLAAAACKIVRRNIVRQPSWALPPASVTLPRPDPGTEFRVPGISRLFTPVSRFYVTDVALPAPQVDRRTWRLEITGLVERPVSLSFAELLAAESVEVDATLVCVHNPVGGHRIGTGRWQGVPVSALLQRAGISGAADHVMARSVDGFSGGFLLLDERCNPIIAFGLNGELLGPEHGAPARLLAPGIYGYEANVKWLKRLEVTQFERARDYWESKGWPREVARVRCQSRIDVPKDTAALRPGPQVVAGVAWSPPNGVTKVEISVDEGDWLRCELAEELSPMAWRHWRFNWDAPDGRHALRVRAWDRDGAQESLDLAPFPRGAGGQHLIHVRVARTKPQWGSGALRAALADLDGRLRLARAGVRAWRGAANIVKERTRGRAENPGDVRPAKVARCDASNSWIGARRNASRRRDASLNANQPTGAA